MGGVYVYSLYDECWYQNDINPPTSDNERLLGALNDYPCGGPLAIITWLNTYAVKDALHVRYNAKMFMADNGVGFNYK